MYRLLSFPALILLCAAGCGTSENATTVETSQVAHGEMFVMEVGSSTEIDGRTLRFDGVAGDSRCPADLTCVWEGVAQLHLSMVEDDMVFPIQLELPGFVNEETPPREDQSMSAGGYVFTVHALNPYPGSESGHPEGAVLSVSPAE